MILPPAPAKGHGGHPLKGTAFTKGRACMLHCLQGMEFLLPGVYTTLCDRHSSVLPPVHLAASEGTFLPWVQCPLGQSGSAAPPIQKCG